MHVNVTSEEVGLAFFDVRYYAGSASLVPGQQVNVCLAGLAYSLRPMAQTSVEVGQGAFWEMESSAVSMKEKVRVKLRSLSPLCWRVWRY